MANALTGDFDVVAEFGILAADRVLAAMHQTQRFLHSLSVRVDDNPPPGSGTTRPTIAGAVDAFGDPVANHKWIGTPTQLIGPLAATDPVYSRLDPLVNLNSAGFAVAPVVPSHLQGLAQLQLFPPTVDVPDATGRNITVRMNVMSRYFPDSNTSPLAEFIRGDLQITAAANQIASEGSNVNVINIDFNADQASIYFTPSYASKALTAEDLAGINLLIRNALRTSFLPSSATLPSNVAQMQFKTLIGAQKTIAVLLNMRSHAASSASVTNVFLTSSDDFAFAAGRDFVLSALQPIIDNLLNQPFPPITFKVPLLFTTWHVSYPVKLNSASFDLQAGKIVLTIQGHASQSNHTLLGPFDFNLTLDFSLLPDGSTVVLNPGGVSLDITSFLAGLVSEIVGIFTDAITQSIVQARDQAIAESGANDTVRNMFDANKNLGNFLNSLLNPPSTNLPPPSQNIQLAYTSVDIQPAGIVLHGSLSVLPWAEPHVEFEQIPSNSGGHLGGIISPLGQGPDYSALKTWIPGGTIGQYEWSVEGQEQAYPFTIEPHKFVLLHSGPEATAGTAAAVTVTAAPAYSPLCLTIRGLRISSSGPAVYQPVSATVCGYTRVPVIPPGLVATLGGVMPQLAVTRRGPAGQIQVTGHAPAQGGRVGSSTPNLLAHFADAKTATQLEVLTRALSQSKRSDVATAILAVLAPDQLAKAPYTKGVIYAEDQDGSWQRIFGVSQAKRPVTLIVGPRGKMVWQQEGPLDAATLAAALAKHLTPAGTVRVSVPRLNARIGQPAPNFLFELAPGRGMPLRKLAGRPVVLGFWRSSSRPSIESVLDLQKTANRGGVQQYIVLAINDGESPELARAVAAENGLSATLVTDPKQEISLAYGVSIWPSTVFLDASGVITGIRYGYLAENVEPSSQGKATVSR